MSIAWIDAALLAALQTQAKNAARLRTHHNFHADLSDACQRLAVAIEPHSYIAPHRHLAPDKAETLLCLRGRLGVVFFDDAGALGEARELNPLGDCLGVHIPVRVYHSIVALEPASVFFETKAGPYRPIGEDERAPWAPREGEAGVPEYLARMRALFPRAS